jgi:guanylate kinase
MEQRSTPKNIFILSGPSGAGEDSVISGLKEYFPIDYIVTTTTREPREGEVEGKNYYFVSREEFEQNISRGEMVEWAQQYNGNYYGVTKKEFQRVEQSGSVGIWKIDYQGVISAKHMFPGMIAIFLIAPLEVMEERIRRRGGVTEEYIRERMKYTKKWLKHKDIYDYTVENVEGQLEQTVRQVKEILERHLESV